MKSNSVSNERKCRICGFTEFDLDCTGHYWVSKDLCSNCKKPLLEILRTDAANDVLEERVRQITKYGFDADHDDRNTNEELRCAARAYLTHSSNLAKDHYWPSTWTWPYKGAKDSYRQKLVTASALIIAEIERLDRAEDNKEEQQ